MASAEPGKLDLVNQAQAHLGQEPVDGLDDASLEYSVAAQKLLRQLDAARDAVLRRHGWLCALAYDTLSPTPDPAVASWKYPAAYLLPPAALRLWEVEGVAWPRWSERWEVGSVDSDVGARTVLRGDDMIVLRVAYTRRAAYAALDRHVADAVAAELAFRAAYSVTGDQNRADKLKPLAEEMVQLALSVDGTQEGGQRVIDSVCAALRRSDGGWCGYGGRYGYGGGGGWPY